MEKTFKNFIISDREPKKGDLTVCIKKGNVNYGKTCLVTSDFVDVKNWKVVISEQIFEEVRTDYVDENGNISIDAYLPSKRKSDDEDSGRVIGLVTPDGTLIDGQHPQYVTKAMRECPLVVNAIKEARERQEDIKQELIDKVLEEIKKDVETGDVTAIDELLKCCPVKNLQAYLPEK